MHLPCERDGVVNRRNNKKKKDKRSQWQICFSKVLPKQQRIGHATNILFLAECHHFLPQTAKYGIYFWRFDIRIVPLQPKKNMIIETIGTNNLRKIPKITILNF